MKKYKFCPYCGNRLIKKSGFFECSNCRKKTFINSLPTASGFIIQDGKYLISKRGIKPYKGMLDVVGGFLNNGEDPTKGVLREFKEETGLTVKIVAQLGVYRGKYEYQGEILNTLNLCYVLKEVKGKIKAQDDVAELLWIPIETIPKQLSCPWLKIAIMDLQKWYAKANKTKINN